MCVISRCSGCKKTRVTLACISCSNAYCKGKQYDGNFVCDTCKVLVDRRDFIYKAMAHFKLPDEIFQKIYIKYEFARRRFIKWCWTCYLCDGYVVKEKKLKFYKKDELGAICTDCKPEEERESKKLKF